MENQINQLVAHFSPAYTKTQSSSQAPPIPTGGA